MDKYDNISPLIHNTMKRILLFTMTALLTVVGAQQAKAYSTDDLTAAGWTQVTSLTNVGDYYYVLVDAGASQHAVTHGASNRTGRPVYYALNNPFAVAGQVWKLTASGTDFTMQSILDDYYFSSGSAGWNDYMSATATDAAFTFTLSDGKYSIVSTRTGQYVGPWNNNGAVSLSDGIEGVAANKSDAQAPGFYIYQMARTTYEAQRLGASTLVANGWTMVTDASGLGLDGYYYIVLDASENGILSGYALTGTDGRPTYTAMSAPATNKAQMWTTVAHGNNNGYAFKNVNNGRYMYSAANWNMQSTTDINTNNTDYIPTLISDGRWTMSNSIATGEFVGTYSNTNYQPFEGEGTASNKAANAGERQFVFYSIQSLEGAAIALPDGGAMAADQWYYFDVASEEDYAFNTTTFADIVYVQDGTRTIFDANASATALPGETGVHLTAGRYYIKSSTANSFVLTFTPATAADMANLATAIAAAKAHTLGFDSGDYAPYNNIANLQAIADAEAIDQTNPANYTEVAIQTIIDGLNNATWTANVGEVNAFYDGNFDAASSVTSNTCPTGWHGSDAHYTDGYWVRLMHGTESSNAGLLHFANGNAMMAKSTPRYGLEQGYTLPLKAATYYKLTFDYAGWGGGNGNRNTTIVIKDAAGNTIAIAPTATENCNENGNSNVNAWKSYTGIFETGDAGDYQLTLSKVEGDGSAYQITYGNMLLVRASAEDLSYTTVDAPMNASVAAAQTAAVEAFEAEKTFANYEALITAINAAQQSADIYTQIKARLDVLTTASQLGSITPETAQGLAYYTNYTNGTYTAASEVEAAYKQSIADYWSTNPPAADDNLSAFIYNQGFELGNLTGWTLPNGASAGDGSYATTHGTNGPETASEGSYYYYSFWTGVPVEQTISNLPNGTYRLTATVASNDTGDAHKVFLYANDKNAGVDVPAGSNTTWQSPASVDFMVLNGTATIGAVGGKQDNTFDKNAPWIFFSADNFVLTFLSEDFTIEPDIPTGLMNKDVQADLNDAKDTYESDPDHENYDALLAAIADANASIAVYQTMNKYITAQKTAANGAIDWTSIDANYAGGEYVNATDFIADYKALVATALASPAANTDMTAFIINPSFEYGDTQGWAHYADGDTGVRGTSNATYTMSGSDGDYLFNVWNNNTAGKYIVQEITGLPDGTYEVSAVLSSAENNNINFTAECVTQGAREMVNTVTVGSDGQTVGIPTTLQVYVENGTLKIGANNNSWFKIDDFRLTYIGPGAIFDYTLVTDPMNKDVRAAQTAAATAFDDDPNLENYYQLDAAIKAAQASADIYAIINTRIGYLDAQKGTVDITALTTKYNDGDYVNADDVIYAYHDLVVAQLGTNPADGTDMTPYIINPSLNFGDATWWNITKPAGNGPMHGTTEMEYWIETAANGSFNYSQWIADLPNGTYKVSAKMYNSLNGQEGEFTATTGVYGTTPTGTVSALVTADGETLTVYETEANIIVTDGTITIGVKNFETMTARWFVVDDFTLTFVSASVPDAYETEIADLLATLNIDTTQPMNAEKKAAYEDALAAWTANGNDGSGHTAENYGKLKETAPNAANSIEAYKKAKAALDSTTDLLTETNFYTAEGYNALFKVYNAYMQDYTNGLLDDNAAQTIQYAIYGNRSHFQKDIAVVPFLGSAWDDAGDYTFQGNTEKLEVWEENFWNYWVNTWSGEGDGDGSEFTVPFMEYWTANTKSLHEKTLTGVIKATPSVNYTVTALLRARVKDGETGTPTGIKAQIVPEDENNSFATDKITQATINWTKVGDTQFYIANISFVGESDYDVDGDGFGDLRLQFVIEAENNVSWFAFKKVFATPEDPVEKEDFEDVKSQLASAIAAAEAHTLGFDFNGDEHGTVIDEYAPHVNAAGLQALELCKEYYETLNILDGMGLTDEQYCSQAPSYLLMLLALKDLTNFTWIPNSREVNGIFWRDDYTKDDVVPLQFYLANGEKGGYYATIFPNGWDLDGRVDAYNTRIIKNNVNTTVFPQNVEAPKPGLFAVKGQTTLFVKWDTNYGEQTGYTLPLKPNTKYILQFNYADWGDATAAETQIEIIDPNHPNSRVDIEDMSTSHGTECPTTNYFTLTGKGQKGDENEDNWYMYRGVFTTPNTGNYTDNYVIYLKKTINTRQMQIALGEITLVRAPEEGSEYVINGNSKDLSQDFTPALAYESVAEAKFTRTFTATNGAEGTWSTLVLPFKMDQKEVESMLGESVELAYYTGCDLEGTQYMLHFEKHKAGVLANVPVMVYYQETHDLDNYTVHDVVVTKEEPIAYDPNGNLDFVGTYGFVNPIPEGDIYISSDNKWKRSKGTTKLQPSRAYFRNVSGDPELGAKLMGFSIDDVPTGIIAIDDEEGTMRVTSGNIYSVDGRLIRQNATTLEGLPRGTYIVDGKKYMVK